MGAAGVTGALLLLGGALWGVSTDPDAPSPPPLTQVLSCQPAWPLLALALTFGPDQLFQFNFSSLDWDPQFPGLPPWPLATETPSQLQAEAILCQELLQALSQAVTGVIPEAKGIPVATIFPQEPPTLGVATTLICSVVNIFPPAVAVTWQVDGVPVTQGVTTTPYTPTEDLSYTLFSYLPVTPRAGTIYSCSVTRQEDNSTIITYWVPEAPVATEELEVAICGAIVVLGGLLALVGVAMVVAGWREVQGAFVMQWVSSCPLASNGSSRGLELWLLFNKNPLVRYEPEGHHFIPCDRGLLSNASAFLADSFNNDSTWLQRAEDHRRACSQLATSYWGATGLRKAPPKLRIIPSQRGEGDPSILLSCFVWGFYPPKISVRWLHNGTPLPPQEPLDPPVGSSGNWSYWVQVTLEVTPRAGDTYSCWVQHPSLEEPLLLDWSPGWSPRLKLMVAMATMAMVVGLGVFIAGVYWYQFQPWRAGYSPLPGDNYPTGGN